MARTLLLSPAGMPCNAPPWGTLAGIDANTGQVKWQVPLGRFGKEPGMVNLGGLITTSTGLTFIGATLDGYFRAFRTATGELLWETKLPASARATPMMYTHRGRQYVAIAAGGHDPKFGPLDD
jgi:quinoprotein glucose dehydrogenase